MIAAIDRESVIKDTSLQQLMTDVTASPAYRKQIRYVAIDHLGSLNDASMPVRYWPEMPDNCCAPVR